MVGKAVISLLDHDEEYIITFPSAYGKSILTVPWFEMGGLITITCPKTGYSADIEFLTKVSKIAKNKIKTHKMKRILINV